MLSWCLVSSTSPLNGWCNPVAASFVKHFLHICHTPFLHRSQMGSWICTARRTDLVKLSRKPCEFSRPSQKLTTSISETWTYFELHIVRQGFHYDRRHHRIELFWRNSQGFQGPDVDDDTIEEALTSILNDDVIKMPKLLMTSSEWLCRSVRLFSASLRSVQLFSASLKSVWLFCGSSLEHHSC